jgi:hypothetical protein
VTHAATTHTLFLLSFVVFDTVEFDEKKLTIPDCICFYLFCFGNRRYAVLGETFTPYLQRLTTSQLRLVTIYISRLGGK